MPSPSIPFQFAAALATGADTAKAVDRVLASLPTSSAGPPDLALLFASPAHVAGLPAAMDQIQAALDARVLLGTTGESIIGGDEEIENEPAIAVWTARLPGVELTPLRLQFSRTPEGGSFVGWPDDIDGKWNSARAMLLLADPFSFPADGLLARMNDDRPGLPIHGGMASGGYEPGCNRLALNDQLHDGGAVGVLIGGPVRVRSVVSQGCRPIGRPLVVTKAQQNLLLELSGQPAIDQLKQLWPELTSAEQQLVQNGLHVGLVTNEYQDRFARGDFLVRNVMGFDGERGAIAIGDFARVGQTVQFHVRDSGTADEDLRELLARAVPDVPACPRGALVFTCNGRGTRLFDAPHHDACAVSTALGGAATAGFFAQGELGPIAGKNFLHGFTASIAIFEPPGGDAASASR